jgi:hypothetical protein
MKKVLPDGFQMTELGPLPQGDARVRLPEAEEARTEADRALAEILQKPELEVPHADNGPA